jgi:CRP-like cAMP-binding protein
MLSARQTAQQPNNAGGHTMQTKKTIEQILAEHPFFSGFAPEYVQLLAGCAQNAYFKAGTYLFREGEAASTFYILRSGRVALETNIPGPGVVTIETIDAGEVVGWSWLFPPYTWHFSARAVEEVRAIVFDGVCLRNKAEQDHELGYLLYKKFMPVLLERLQATRLQLLDMYSVQ